VIAAVLAGQHIADDAGEEVTVIEISDPQIKTVKFFVVRRLLTAAAKSPGALHVGHANPAFRFC
jgi:hypothetical protein